MRLEGAMISLTSPVKTWAHPLNPSLKLSCLCATTILLFALDGIVWHFAILALVFGLYLSAGKTFAQSGLTNLKPLWFFVLVIAVWHVLIGAITDGLVILLRLMSAIALANFVTMTTSISEMMDVLKKLFSPLQRFGISTHKLELCVALVIRFTPEITRKGTLLSQSWRARSRGRPTWRIVMPFTVLAIDDAENVALALKARGGILKPTED